jgi:hypothetical protein
LAVVATVFVAGVGSMVAAELSALAPTDWFRAFGG